MKTAFLLLALAAPVRAAAGFEACRADAAAVCPKAEAGPERMRCLEAHPDKISKDCGEHLKAVHAAGEAFKADCKADIGGSCLNLQGHALMECLEGQGDKLSKTCSDRLKTMHAARHAAHERIAADCKDDAQKLCVGIASGEGRIGACLRAHEDKLSPACRGALK